MAVFRVSGSGALETTYAPLPKSVLVQDMALAPDGTMLLAGSVQFEDEDFPRMGIGRRLPDGKPDPTFGTNGTNWLYAGRSASDDIEILRDGRYVLAGQRESEEGIIARVWN